MGQNVNYLLGNQSQLMGADPELYRQQLIQQEQARIQAMPAQNQLGAQLGNLLGRGISNVANDRGFFEVTNPVLQKLQKIQSVYDTAMQQADPNDPMSFYTTLQKQFADAGLGQQALMASVEAKKFEDMGLKTEAAKTELYKKNPTLLDIQIEKARTSGNDKLANQLAEQRGQIQVQIDLDRSKEAAQIGLIGAQTVQAKAAAENYRQQAADNKVSVTSIPDGNGGATIIYADKQTGKEVNRISVTSAVVDEYLKKKGGQGGTTTPPGERPPLNTFGGNTVTPTPVPAPTSTTTPSAPMAANNTTVSLYDQATQTYKLTQDPEYLKIVDYARQNATQIAQDPALRDRVGQAMKDLQAKRQTELGSFVKFQ